MILNKIKQFFDTQLNQTEEQDAESLDKQLKIASAALLIETSKADFDLSDIEKEVITRSLKESFELSEGEISLLFDSALQSSEDSISLYDFTSTLNNHLNSEKKEKIIYYMWRVAFADGFLDKYEEATIRKVADLLYIPHSVFIKMKLSAKK